jgi:hypothetical protein
VENNEFSFTIKYEVNNLWHEPLLDAVFSVSLTDPMAEVLSTNSRAEFKDYKIYWVTSRLFPSQKGTLEGTVKVSTYKQVEGRSIPPVDHVRVTFKCQGVNISGMDVRLASENNFTPAIKRLMVE